MNKLMKGFLLVSMIILLFSPNAFASPETVIMELTPDGSGTTTVTEAPGISATSPFYVTHSPRGSDIGKTHISGMIFQERKCVLQIESITQPDITTSGATFTIKYRGTNIDDFAHWAASGSTSIINNMALSGDTLYYVEFTPDFCNYLRFEFVSGESPFKTVKIRINHK